MCSLAETNTQLYIHFTVLVPGQIQQETYEEFIPE